jgi:hypothetical protein
MKLIVTDSNVIVYDEGLGRLSVFDTEGMFLRSAQLSQMMVGGFADGPNGTVLFTSGADPGARVVQFDLNGRRLRKLIRPPPGLSLAANAGQPVTGLVCTSQDNIIFANPWIYEIVAVTPSDDASYLWAKRWESPVAKLEHATAGLPPTRGALLGFECGTELSVLATFGVTSGHLVYDFFNREFSRTGRIIFTREDLTNFPGFIGALKGKTLVTYRTKPFSQVFVYRVVGT